MGSIYPYGQNPGKVNQARSWLTERRDAQERREQRLEAIEIGVVALITVEILLSFIFGGVGIYEGLKQGQALDHMDSSADATATTMQTVRDELKSFAADQAKMREILQKEEDARLAQLAKKPRLALFVGHVRLDKPHGPLKPGQETDTNVTYDFVLRNVGDATANKLYIRALLPPDTWLTANAPSVPANDVPDRPVHAFVWFYPEPLTPKGYVEISITFVFPKGHAPFQVRFNTDSLEIANETPLGVLAITPRKPPS